jgi:hypothetical protein
MLNCPSSQFSFADTLPERHRTYSMAHFDLARRLPGTRLPTAKEPTERV